MGSFSSWQLLAKVFFGSLSLWLPHTPQRRSELGSFFCGGD